MKNFRLLFTILFSLAAFGSSLAQRVSIVHTNDTHSIVDPYFENDRGGAMRRMAVIDSIRHAVPDVILVDAGDAVQGSLYFTVGRGDAESKIMNYMDYDIQILGNHEFDNGMDALACYIDNIDADLLATNYDFSQTPLANKFHPYSVKTVAGKRIGFFAINVLPDGLIKTQKIAGVRYLDPIDAANSMAWYLRNVEYVDKVIAVTHIGYSDDLNLIRSTRGIDAVIGGHSHTTVPSSDRNKWHAANLDGDSVVIVQTGRYGANIGELTLDFDADTIGYKLIPINSRLDSFSDDELAEIIAPFKHMVDSISSIKVGTASASFDQSPAMANWMADFVLRDSRRLDAAGADIAIINTGGIRSSFPKGTISKGNIIQCFPFDNYEVILEVPGHVLMSMLPPIINTGGVGLSTNVSATLHLSAPDANRFTINGKAIDPDHIYRVATIDYVADGNDGFTPLQDCVRVASDNQILNDAMINAFTNGFLKGKRQRPDTVNRISILPE